MIEVVFFERRKKSSVANNFLVNTIPYKKKKIGYRLPPTLAHISVSVPSSFCLELLTVDDKRSEQSASTQ
jgi:hypothetical protein